MTAWRLILDWLFRPHCPACNEAIRADDLEAHVNVQHRGEEEQFGLRGRW